MYTKNGAMRSGRANNWIILRARHDVDMKKSQKQIKCLQFQLIIFVCRVAQSVVVRPQQCINFSFSSTFMRTFRLNFMLSDRPHCVCGRRARKIYVKLSANHFQVNLRCCCSIETMIIRHIFSLSDFDPLRRVIVGQTRSAHTAVAAVDNKVEPKRKEQATAEKQ